MAQSPPDQPPPDQSGATPAPAAPPSAAGSAPGAPLPPTRLHSFESFDGTRIAWRVVGDTGDSSKPWLILCHGYGGTFNTWEPIVHRLADCARVLMWDYRGMHHSDTPADTSRLRVEDHVRDLAGIIAREGISQAFIGGWSVGVQVALEAWRRLTDGGAFTVQGLMLVCGAYERILHEARGGGRMAQMQSRAMVRAVSVADRALPVLRGPLKRIAGSPIALPMAERLGICTGQPPALIPAIHAILDMNLRQYMRMIRLADDHQTRHYLAEIDVPVLVVAGGRDPLTPLPIAQRLVEQLPNGRLFVEPAGTHYALVEFPGEIAAAFREHIAAALADPSATAGSAPADPSATEGS